MLKKQLKTMLISFISALILLFNLQVLEAHAADYENWMSQIRDNTSITDLSIPGTHDSAARYEPVDGTAKCQTLSIDEQLKCGVRYLDIRCRHFNDAFAIHHGSVYQKANFDDVLRNCKSFLKSHPNETIIMSVKEEYNAKNNTKTFEQAFREYVNRYNDIWYLNDKAPMLSNVRGKIVLVRRFRASGCLGINATGWEDNTTFSTDRSSPLYIQDHYKVGKYEDKWNDIENTLDRAAADKDNYLYINYSSGYKSVLGIPAIKRVKDYMNPRILSYMSSHNKKASYGIIVMDFVTPELCSSIINTNANFRN